tara:strand:+ start:1839 stop:2669 length:831 start_codon:yes stop_codon:yes gene_type:complete
MKNSSIDIVIPTLNGKMLYQTINSINSGAVKPKKIYCIYFNEIKKNRFKKFRNIKFIRSSHKGQVEQRNLGFSYCKSELVIQCDDDVKFKRDTIQKLLITKKILGRKFLVGPRFFNERNIPLHTSEKNENLFTNLYKTLICDAPYGKSKHGKITSLTLSYGPGDNIGKKYTEVDWLPGGCVMFSKNLLRERFKKFKFKGKAYCEDIFFSLQRNVKGYRHVVCNNSTVFTEISRSNFNLNEFFKEIKVRKFLLSLTGGNIIRFRIWMIFEIILRIVR